MCASVCVFVCGHCLQQQAALGLLGKSDWLARNSELKGSHQRRKGNTLSSSVPQVGWCVCVCVCAGGFEGKGRCCQKLMSLMKVIKKAKGLFSLIHYICLFNPCSSSIPFYCTE